MGKMLNLLLVILFWVSLYHIFKFTISLLLKRKILDKKMKYPPSKRIFQFIFCVGNFIFFGGILIFLGPYLFLVSYNSTYRLLIMLCFAAISVASLYSIFRPRGTKLIPVFYAFMGLSLYMDNPKTVKPTTYHDICNELRDDPKCTESLTGFTCEAGSKHGAITKDKSICVNTTGANSDYRFGKYKSRLVGLTNSTKLPYILVRNLPRNNCRHRSCGHMYESEIVSFDNQCSNCLGESRVTSKLRMELLPEGADLTVIDSFQLEDIGHYGAPHEVLVVKNDRGDVAEMDEYIFENIGKNRVEEKENKIIHKIREVQKKGEADRFLCFSWEVYAPSIPKKYNLKGPKYSDYIEIRLLNFIKSFRLEDEMKILGLAWRKGASTGQLSACANVKYRSESAILLSHYYYKDWGLYVDEHLYPSGSECLPENNRDCYKLTGIQTFSYSTLRELLRSTPLDKYKRGNEEEVLR